TSPEENTEPIQPTQLKRGPGRPKGSRTRPKNSKPTVVPLACQGSTRLQAASKRRRTGEPDDTMDEQPDDNEWLSIQPTPADLPQPDTQQVSLEHQLTQFINEFTTVNEAGNTSEPDDEEELDPESPEYHKLVILKYKQRQAITIGSSPPVFTTDAPTIEDPNDERHKYPRGGRRRGAGAMEERTTTYNAPTSDGNIPANLPTKSSCRRNNPRPGRSGPSLGSPPTGSMPDYQLLKLRKAHQGRDWTDLFIHNIYNRPGSNTLRHLKKELSKRPHGEHIILGDMNAHHPRWGGSGTRADQEAKQLLEIANEWGLELTTQQGRPTWSRNDQSSVIDLTFITSNLVSRLINCERADDIEHASDHFPIRTVLDIITPVAVQQKRRNWSATDDQKLIQKIEGGLQTGGLYQADPQKIEATCQELM
ncbi:hypothetical protein PENANT_c410G08752, partial [Penicillium antarcticum]